MQGKLQGMDNGPNSKSSGSISSDDLRQVEYLLKNGRKVAAVKHYRLATGADLTDSVQAVERIKQGLTEGDDGAGPPIQSKAIEPVGCSGVVVLLVVGPALLMILRQVL